MQSNEDGWWHFVELCTQFKKPEQLDALLKLFLTLDEQDAVAGRYLIIKELLSGDKSQREISEHHHLSIAKITRGSNALKTLDENVKQQLKKLML